MEDAPRVRIRVFKGRQVWHLVRACASVEGFLLNWRSGYRYLGNYLALKKKKTPLNLNDIYLMSQAAKISDVKL